MPEFVVRPARLTDIEAIIALTNASWARTYDPLIGADVCKTAYEAKHVPDLFASEIGGDAGVCLVAEADDGALVGHAGGTLRDDGTLYIDRLHVVPAAQGAGLAARLLDAAARAPGDRVTAIELEVLIGNDRALAFYRRYGFVAVRQRGPEHGLGGIGDIVMRRAWP